MNTLLLDIETWDLKVSPINNIELSTGAYAIAQDVASAARTFLGEVWYDTTQGVSYLIEGSPEASILGQSPSVEYMKSQLINVGLTVPEVGSIVCFLTGPDITTRQVGGQLQIRDTNNALVGVTQTDVFLGGAPWYVNAIIPES